MKATICPLHQRITNHIAGILVSEAEAQDWHLNMDVTHRLLIEGQTEPQEAANEAE